MGTSIPAAFVAVWVVVAVPWVAAQDLVLDQGVSTDSAQVDLWLAGDAEWSQPTWTTSDESSSSEDASGDHTSDWGSVETDIALRVDPIASGPLEEASDEAIATVAAAEETLGLETIVDAPSIADAVESILSDPIEATLHLGADTSGDVSVGLSASVAGATLAPAVLPEVLSPSNPRTWKLAAEEQPEEAAWIPAPVAEAPPVLDASVESQGSSVRIADVDPIVLALMAIGLLGGTAAVGFFALPGWKTALRALFKASPLALLFSRIDRGDALDHARRQEIFEFVRQNPGERIEVVRRTLGLPNGTMLHHLGVLVDKELVRAVKDGAMTRLYPAGPRVHPLPYLAPKGRTILATVAARPGIAQREIAKALGASERMISYHVTRLERQGVLRIEREGPRKRCFPQSAAPVSVPVLATVPQAF